MKNKDILILGKGFIGERLQEALGCAISDAMIHSYEDALKAVESFKPKVLINCIGFTGKKNVDGCEDAIDETLSANVFVPLMLAEVAFRKKIKLIHISSGCIFHFDYKKDAPLNEEKEPDFFDLFYSRTKIYSERALKTLSKQANILILRIRIPLDDRNHPRSILNKIISFKKVIDLPNSVTYIPDFIKALKHLIKVDARGVFNVVNKGGLRYPELLEVYRKYVPDFTYEVIDYKKLKLTRTNILLSTKKLEKTGFKVRPIKEVFQECVKNYLKS